MNNKLKKYSIMKTVKNKIGAFVLIISLFASCVENDDFTVPTPTNNVDPTAGINVNTTVAQAKALFSGGNTEFTSDDLVLEGYVVSSDASGNFYKELYIQDHPTTPTAAVRVAIDQTSLYQTYNIGRRIVIRLPGLSIGEGDGDVLTIGEEIDGEIEAISATKIADYVVRSNEVVAVEGLPITSFSEITDDHISMFVSVSNTQINRNQLGLPFVEPDAQFDSQRTLESCEDGSSFSLETSAFSDFKQLSTPLGSGTVSGIITKSFEGADVLVLNEASDMVFTGERCDPEIIDCGLATTIGGNNLFADNFETQATNNPISGNGWTNFIEAGSESWEAYTSGGTNASLGISARMGSFMSGDASNIAWLITPAIDMDAQENEVFRFQTSNSFSDGSILEILISTDWDGNPANITSAIWGILDAATVVSDDQFFGDWVESGNIDLSCVTGTAYIAFKYTGSENSDFDGTYELDEISIDSD